MPPAAGTIVATRLVAADDVASVNVFLKPGKYRLLVGGGTTDGSALGSLAYALSGLILSDPIGPQPVTTTPPAGSPPPITWTGSSLYGSVLPISPTSPPWWIAPPTEWMSVATLLAGLVQK